MIVANVGESVGNDKLLLARYENCDRVFENLELIYLNKKVYRIVDITWPDRNDKRDTFVFRLRPYDPDSI